MAWVGVEAFGWGLSIFFWHFYTCERGGAMQASWRYKYLFRRGVEKIRARASYSFHEWLRDAAAKHPKRLVLGEDDNWRIMRLL